MQYCTLYTVPARNTTKRFTEMRSCSVVTCNIFFSKKGDTVQFFNFPSDPRLRNVWRLRTGHPDSWIPTKNSSICSRHFSDDKIRRNSPRNTLLKDAVPTLELPGYYLHLFKIIHSRYCINLRYIVLCVQEVVLHFIP